jgi:hypothetical protein
VTRSGARVDDVFCRRTRPLLRLAALLHAVGMPARARDLRGGFRYTGHEPIGARKAETVMRPAAASNADIERVDELVASSRTCSRPMRRTPACDAGCCTCRRTWCDLFRLRIALWRAHPVGARRRATSPNAGVTCAACSRSGRRSPQTTSPSTGAT